MARGSKSKDLSLAQALGQFLERTLIPDLRLRVEESPSVKRALDDALARERAAGRTADDPIAYRERTLEQVGAAWLLDCVFVRFLEDRGFVSHRRLAGDGAVDAQERFGAAFPGLAGNAREYLLAVFREAGNLPGARELLGARHDVARRLGPQRGRGGRPAPALPGGAPRQEPAVALRQRRHPRPRRPLSRPQRRRARTLRAPPDAGLRRVVHPRSHARPRGEGVRPRRVSHDRSHLRIRALRARGVPSAARAARAQGPVGRCEATRGDALRHVYGVDLNPFAVAITRFRLLVAYLGAAGIRACARRPRTSPRPPRRRRRLAAVRRQEPLARREPDRQRRATLLGGDHFVLEDPVAGRAVFGHGYHAVVGNPPYIVCRDAALRELYRARYPDSAKGKYRAGGTVHRALLRTRVDGGFVGLINANSFMKREFGKGLVEKVLPRLDLTGVIDTSGAYIPGHGTPTVILFGRNQHRKSDTVRAVLGRRGEPETPEDPAKGKVWSSIADHVGDRSFENDFVTITDLSRDTLAKHPWSLGGGGAGELKQHIEERCDRRLQSLAVVGVGGMSNADEVFLADSGTANRQRMPVDYTRSLVIGEEIRDWSHATDLIVFFPYSKDLVLQPIRSEALVALWPYASVLWSRVVFGGGTYRSAGRPWWEWHQVTRSHYKTPLTIVYAEVATHNHFVLDRGGKVFKQTAPVIKLPATATEEYHLALLAWLNSSLACFWMKQVCYPKATTNGDIGGGISDERWEVRFEFDGTKVGQLPLSDADFAFQAGRALDSNAALSATYHPTAIVARFDPTKHASLNDLLSCAIEQTQTTHDLMVSQQEELDWRWYEHLGLLTEEERTKHAKARDAALVEEIIPPYPVGLRAFERAMFLSGASTAWFERNGYLVPADPVMARLSRAMHRLIAVRMEIIQSNRFIGLIERPEYKRRWTKRDWNEEVRDAATTALLDAVEAVATADVVVHSLRALTSAALRDPRVHAIAALRFPGEDDLVRALADLVEAESVAFLTAWRFTDSGLEKRARWETTWALQRREDAGETSTRRSRFRRSTTARTTGSRGTGRCAGSSMFRASGSSHTPARPPTTTRRPSTAGRAGITASAPRPSPRCTCAARTRTAGPPSASCRSSRGSMSSFRG
jgi:hypothetical protein